MRGGEQVESKNFNPHIFLEQGVDVGLKRSASIGRHQDPDQPNPPTLSLQFGRIRNKMSRYFMVLLSFGLVSPLLLVAGEIKCSQRETLLRQVPNVAMQLTECLLECTGMTYVNKLQLQDNRNIRLKDSTEGKEPLDGSL